VLFSLRSQPPQARRTRPRPPEPPPLGYHEYRAVFLPTLFLTYAELFSYIRVFNRDLLRIIESYIGAISCEGGSQEPCTETPADIYLHETPVEREDQFAPSRFSRCRFHVCKHGTPRGRVCYEHKQCHYYRNTRVCYDSDESDSDESDSE
jgi:hypothetical protein